MLRQTQVFNNSNQIALGWYWALRSSDVKRGKARSLNFLGRELVVYRGKTGKAFAMDAYCPHMGAHLAEGKVEGDELRCLFHYWKFNSEGICTEIPCQSTVAGVPKIRTWPVEERHGLIWIWPGQKSEFDIPVPPELKNVSTDSMLGKPFVKECHPNVMMINAIDAQHFNSVHQIAVPLHLEPETVSNHQIVFSNTTRFPDLWWSKPLQSFYEKAITYSLSYWNGSTGSVTLGPDFLHFYIIFALRPTREGKSEGQTILITKKRNGFSGKILNYLLLKLTYVVGNYFANGDTLIFKSIKFNLQMPVKADSAIIGFIQHLESQPAVNWQHWSITESA